MTTSTFIDKVTSLLPERITSLDNIMILRDFNINTRESTNADNAIFNDTMAALRLKRNVHSPTHRLGSTLDLIFAQLHGEVKFTNATTHGYISNQCMVSIDLRLHKLRYHKIKKAIRDKTRMTAEALLTNFTALTLETNASLDQVCHKVCHRTTQCTRKDCPTENNQILRQA